MKSILPALLILFISHTLDADVIDVVSPAGSGIEAEPRKSVTLPVIITNNSPDSVSVLAVPQLPLEFAPLFSDVPLVIEAGAEGTKLLSFFIPQETAAGRYPVSYAFLDSNTDKIAARYDAMVTVLPYYDLTLTAAGASPYVVAGEDITVTFLLDNRSNTALEVGTRFVGNYDFDLDTPDLVKEPFRIEANQSIILPVTVKTKPLANGVARYRLEMLAFSVAGNIEKDIRAVDTVFVEIIPNISEQRRRFNTIPVDLSVSHSEEISSNWEGDIRLQAKGGGFLDESRAHEINFTLLSKIAYPDLRFPSEDDVYRFSYKSDFLDLYLGDHGHEISPVLGTNRYGRGVLARVPLDRFRVGGLYYFSPLVGLEESYLAGLFDFFTDNPIFPDGYRYRASVNLLSRIEDYLLLDLYQEFKPIPEINLELDLVTGTRFDERFTWSGAFNGSGEHGWLNYSLYANYAQPGFPGEYSDRYLVMSSADASFFQRTLKLLGGYGQGQRNLLLNDTLSDAALTRNVHFGATYKLLELDMDISLMWKLRTRLDLLGEAAFDDLNNSVKLDLLLRLPPFKIHTVSEWAAGTEKVTGASSFEQRYAASAAFTPTDTAFYNFNMEFSALNSDYYDSTSQLSIGFSTVQQLGIAKMKLGVSNRYYIRNTAFDGFDLRLTSGAEFVFPNHHKITADFSYDVSQVSEIAAREFAFSIGYATTLDIPVSPKRDVGRVQGYVFNGESGAMTENVILRVANSAVVSDTEGKFRFTSISEGKHHVEVDTSRVGLGFILDIDTPIEINVEARETTEISIPIVRGADIDGIVSLYGSKAGREGLLGTTGEKETTDFADEDLERVAGYPDVLLEIRRNGEVRRIFSDALGRFSFPDIRPGTWTLSISHASLPRFHRFIKDEFEIKVEPGESAAVEVKIVPVRRSVTLLDSGVAPLRLEQGESSSGIADLQGEEFVRRMEERYGSIEERAPRLLRLEWGISPGEAESVLLGRQTGFAPLEQISADTDFSIYRTYGRAQFDLAAEVLLTFVRAGDTPAGYHLSQVKILVDGSDNDLGADEMGSAFGELFTLFSSRWKTGKRAADENAGEIEYRRVITDIDTSFSFDFDAARFVIIHEDTWIVGALGESR